MSIRYHVAIHEAAMHLVDVTLNVSRPDKAGQQLRLPNWIPGSYMIRDFSRNIVSISASSQGQPVALTKLDKSTWQAEPELSDLEVSYRVYAWDLSVRAAHVDRLHAFLNGTSIFLSVMGQEQAEHQVVFERPAHDTQQRFRLSTTLSAVDTDAAGFGLYKAADYDELIDHPVEQGTFKRLTFTACGVAHEVVLTGACHFDEARVVADLTRICEYQIRFFGEPAPVERYVFMVMVVDAGYGGLEHRASTALMITRENLPIVGEVGVSDKYLDFLGLCSHEYFHTWNVKRIKPARFIPYELNAESYTELLWFFEGMTSYYDDLVLVRTGLIDTERYLGVLSKTLTRVRRGAGSQTQSVTDSSFDAWHKFYKQDENAPNAIVSYYAKGALIALCMDALLRRHSDHDMSLDTMMRVLWNRWLATGEGMAEKEPQQLIGEMTGMDVSEFFDKALYSTDELPLEESLASLGVSLQWCERLSSSDVGGWRAAECPENAESAATRQDKASEGEHCQPRSVWLGANVTEASGGVRIAQVMAGGPAAQAGLSAGDVIVALNRLSVDKADLDNHMKRHADRQQLLVHFFRLGQLHETLLPLRSPPRDTAVLRVSDTDKISRWLSDTRLAVLPG